MRTSEAFWSRKEFGMGCRHTQLMRCWFPLSWRNIVDALMSVHACNAASRGYTMGKVRPAFITRALASSATPPAGWARILHRLVKRVISEATFAAPEHGHVRPEQEHTPAKASYAGPFQAASHSAIWAAAYLLCSPSCLRVVVSRLRFCLILFLSFYILNFYIKCRKSPRAEGMFTERPRKKGKRYLNCTPNKSRHHEPILLLLVFNSVQL